MSSRSRQPANIPYSNFWLVAAEDAVRPRASENRKNYANAVGSKEKHSKRCIMTARSVAQWLEHQCPNLLPLYRHVYPGAIKSIFIGIFASRIGSKSHLIPAHTQRSGDNSVREKNVH